MAVAVQALVQFQQLAQALVLEGQLLDLVGRAATAGPSFSTSRFLGTTAQVVQRLQNTCHRSRTSCTGCMASHCTG